MEVLAVGIASLTCAVGMVASCCSCCYRCISGEMENDTRFIQLAENPHGEERWKLVNSLHRDYGVSRNTILDEAKSYKYSV